MSKRVLPSGTVTFLFTDIERSTESAASLGDERYAEALKTHRDLLRPAFEQHDGVEVGTEGDAFFVAFARAGDAVAAAVDGQRALESYAWPGEARIRVRMGAHTGEVLVRDGDYVGHDVHKAKRICDAGNGGQILVSEVTAGLITARLPDGSTISDLGPHRLKDLGEPQRLFQVMADGLRAEFPALRSLESFTHNLPAQASSFIGREREIAEIRELLESHRLVTLTGVGGCGKTRLAFQVGAEMLDHHPDGVFFVDLAALADPEAVAGSMATAVGVPRSGDIGEGPSGPTEQLLLGYLSSRHCLLLLDNCEHLLDAIAKSAAAILARCPHVVLLATSREALDVEGEQSWRVPSLSVPEDDDVQSSEAVSLFKARAQAVRSDFELTPDNVSAVTQICRRLDGIPLAIEFAAARIAHMSPGEIAEGLDDMFTLLSGGRRRHVQRQQTLQAALDWSYELLTEPEQLLLRRLAVFPASFTRAAAEGISSDEQSQERVLDLLGSLVAKSLVTTIDERGTTRYRLIETVRAYATEKLRESGESDLYRTRHRDFFLAWMRSIPWETTIFSFGGQGLFGLTAEAPNILAALAWSEAQGRLDLVVAMAARAGRYWTTYGSPEDGYRWLTIARPEDLDLPTDERVAALATASFCANALQRPDAPDLVDRAIAASGGERSAPTVYALADRAPNMAIVSRFRRDPDLAAGARAQIEQAKDHAQGASNEARSYVLQIQGVVELILGDVAAAAAAFSAAPSARGAQPISLGVAWHILGEHDRALALAQGWLEVETTRRTAYWSFVATSIAVMIAGAGDVDEGCEILRRYLDDARNLTAGLEVLIVGFAVIAYLRGDHPKTSRLLAWVRARTFDAGRIIPNTAAYALYEHYARLVRAALPAEEARRTRDEGKAMSEDEAVACALQACADATA